MTSFATFDPSPADVEAAVEHLLRLVSRESPSGREAPAVDEAEKICRELDLAVARMAVEEGRDNLLVGDPEPRVLFCTHLDTVPPFVPASRDERYIYGRGSADAKGIAISMLYALRALRQEGVGGAACLLVVGEETDHSGARAAARSGLAPRTIILGEPCENRPAAGQKGLLKLRLHASGVPGHSAYPDVGVSAVHRLLTGLEAMRAKPLPADPALGDTTVNVGQIQGGVAPNVIAAEAWAVVLIRCAAPVDAIRAEVVARIPPDVVVEELSRAEPIEFYADPQELGLEPGEAVPFNTDAHTLRPLGARMLLMGPGDMRCAHAPGERLGLDELRLGIKTFAQVAVRML